jgi:tRNA C32,U32 (ribose-2'-O)-methylase TrmJ
MNKEDYIKIKNNPTLLYILTCAYKGRYLVGVSVYNQGILKDIYERTFPNKPKPATNCGQCVYDMCYELGEAYFNYSEKPQMPTLDEMKAEILMEEHREIINEENQPEEPEPEVSEEEMKEVYDAVKADDDEIDLTENKGSKKKAGKKSKK